MPASATPSPRVPRLTQLTPILIVDQVESGIRFWVERFGFEVTNQVPGPTGALVFASVQRDGLEVMYQTRASVLDDGTHTAAELAGHSVALFLQVADLDEVEIALAGAPVVKARHQTFYGSSEIYVKEPGGNTVGFAQFG